MLLDRSASNASTTRFPLGEAVRGGLGYSHRLLVHVRGDAVRRALARVSERPTCARLSEHTHGVERIKTELRREINVTDVEAVARCHSVSRPPPTVALAPEARTETASMGHRCC
jgi:hypothetical protein